MCDERERLIGYLYDECEPAERRAVEAHLEQCPECRAEVQALRQVRADLLAWDVPGQPNVWRPFAVTATPSWWKQVPAWALSAAAGLVLAAGFAGGLAARALDAPSAAETVMVAAPPARPAAAAVTRAELTAAQQQMIDLMRAELEQYAARVTDLRQSVRYASRPTPDPALQQVSLLSRESDEMFETLGAIYNQTEMHRTQTDQRIRRLEDQIAALDFAIRNTLGVGGPGGGER